MQRPRRARAISAQFAIMPNKNTLAQSVYGVNQSAQSKPPWPEFAGYPGTGLNISAFSGVPC
jgi:hypothetical protein